ncbi:MAG TPA: hypothetical protein VIX86_23045 [Streptosporangiaceae bacterium]
MIVIVIAAALALAGLVVAGTFRPSHVAAASAYVPGRPVPTQTGAAGIPVLVYHEMDNRCAAAAPVCNAPDPESVSKAQFTSQMNYLRAQGYHTVTLAQYLNWLADPAAVLPRKPILLTVDNGIGNFLEGAQPILARDGYTMTAFVVTGFADGASGICKPPQRIAGRPVNVQPGCGRDNYGWDLTWKQLRGLSPRVYSFALEAGASGHFPQTYSRTCPYFYPCRVPGETTRAYQARVTSEISSGLAELAARLPGRVNTHAWVVPYSALGYRPCHGPYCTPQPSTGPRGWLPRYAAARFSAVFVEDAFRNGVQHERFRFDVSGPLTEAAFQARLQALITASSFAR